MQMKKQQPKEEGYNSTLAMSNFIGEVIEAYPDIPEEKLNSILGRVSSLLHTETHKAVQKEREEEIAYLERLLETMEEEKGFHAKHNQIYWANGISKVKERLILLKETKEI